MLLSDEASRRYFAGYFQHHTEIQFAIRAGRAADSALEQLAQAGGALESPPRTISGRTAWHFAQIGQGAVVAACVLAVLAAAVWYGATAGRVRPGGRPAANVAWLVNAQDCQWAGRDQKPGRDMKAGKILRLERGLAEIEFDKGARVILQGPAGFELTSESAGRLLYGTLTVRVPAPARGFTVISPGGKVVDLGTEFGLSVDERGATTVLRVFTGEVEAFPAGAGPRPDHGITIHQDQTARLNGLSVALAPAGRRRDPVTYIRAIVPQPVAHPRTLRLDFSRSVPGTLEDARGQGIGLTHRLPGTGAAFGARDANLRLRTDDKALELTTTRSDLNTQERIATGEYLGFRLRDLGFTGAEDFELSATILNIPGLKQVGQFGLYAGARSDTSIRGGLISRVEGIDGASTDIFRMFLVNNSGGVDHDIYEVGLIKTGDDLRISLCRRAGRYSLVVDNLRAKSSSTLEIAHPAFLDREKDLYAGLFGANTQSDLRKTLTVREVAVTVWTTQVEIPTITAATRRPPTVSAPLQ